METEKIILFVASILAIFIFFAHYKFNKFGSKIPNPLFSFLLIMLLISLIVLPVYAYNPKYLPRELKNALQFIPMLFIITEHIFKRKNKELK